MMKRLSFGIILSLFIFAAAACAVDEATVTTTANTSDEATTEEAVIIDDLPEFDFEGKEFKILTGLHANWQTSAFSVESESGEIINDAIFRRNRKIEDRFKIKFIETVRNDIFEVNNLLKKMVSAGDDEYDMAMMIDRYAFAAALENQLYSYGSLPYINLDKVYWNKSLNDSLSVGGKLFFAVGYDNLTYLGNMDVLVFNKSMAVDYGLENPYDLVRNGKWTIDKFFEMARAVTLDIDGDGVWTDTDQYGVACSNNMFFPSFWVVSKEATVKKDADGMLSFNVPGNERLFSIFNKLYDLTYDGSNAVFNNAVCKAPNYAGSNGYSQIMDMFSNRMCLFGTAFFVSLLETRSMEDDMGILPYPLYEETQPGTTYGARSQGGFPYVIPITNTNLEMTSVIMEALACESYKTVVPAMYDVVLKQKVSRDTDSEEMLDMMIPNRYTDIGESYWWDDIEMLYESAFTQKTNTFASITEENQDKIDGLLKKATDFFAALE